MKGKYNKLDIRATIAPYSLSDHTTLPVLFDTLDSYDAGTTL